MIEALTEAGSSRCSRSTAAVQAPTGTANHLGTKAVPVVPAVPAEEQNIIRDTDISRVEEQSLQHAPQGKAPLSLSSKSTGTPGTTGTGQDFCGVERSRNFISNGNNGTYSLDVRSPLGHRAVLNLTPISEAAFNERAAVLEYDAGLMRVEAERQAAAEQGFATPEELFAAVAAGWAERLRGLQASERLKCGQQCLMSALAFIEHGWALEALRCGWDELAIVGACPVAPWERLDRIGAAYSMFTPIAVTAGAILYRSSGCTCTKWMARAIKWTPKGVKAPLRLLRGSQAEGAVLPWERAR
jgi:hypothetical protein